MHTNAKAAQNYLRTRVMTATPEQLQLMLYDGAIRFTDLGRAALEAGNLEASYINLTKAQKIVAELLKSLRHDQAPELCGRLASLYNYVFRKLVEANSSHQTAAAEEALGIMRYQRETWVMLLDQLGKARAATAAHSIDMPAPNTRMEASISMCG